MVGHPQASRQHTVALRTAQLLRRGLPAVAIQVFGLAITVGLLSLIFMVLDGISIDRLSVSLLPVAMIILVSPYSVAWFVLTLYGRTRRYARHAAVLQPVIYHMLIGSQAYRASGHGYGVSGTVQDNDGKPLNGKQLTDNHIFFLATALTSPAHLYRRAHDNDWQVNGRPADGALLALARKAGIDIYNLAADFKRQKTTMQYSKNLASSTFVINDQPLTFLRGNLADILQTATMIADQGKTRKLKKADREQIEKFHSKATRASAEVAAFAYIFSAHPEQVIFLGAAAIHALPHGIIHTGNAYQAQANTATITRFSLGFTTVLAGLLTVSALLQWLLHTAPVLVTPEIIILGLLTGALLAWRVVAWTPFEHKSAGLSPRNTLFDLISIVGLAAGAYLLYFVIHHTSSAFITLGSMVHRQATAVPLVLLALLTAYAVPEQRTQKIKVTALVLTVLAAILYVPPLTALTQTGPLDAVSWLLIIILFCMYGILQAFMRHNTLHSRQALFSRHSPEKLRQHLVSRPHS